MRQVQDVSGDVATVLASDGATVKVKLSPELGSALDAPVVEFVAVVRGADNVEEVARAPFSGTFGTSLSEVSKAVDEGRVDFSPRARDERGERGGMLGQRRMKLEEIATPSNSQTVVLRKKRKIDTLCSSFTATPFFPLFFSPLSLSFLPTQIQKRNKKTDMKVYNDLVTKMSEAAYKPICA